MSRVEEAAVVLNRFGDEHSTLLDRFERLSFEVHLNQAILGRSLSEPGTFRPSAVATAQPHAEEKVRRRPGIGKVLKKLLRPFLGRKSNNKTRKGTGAVHSKADPIPSRCTNPNPVPTFSKAFSRSLRV